MDYATGNAIELRIKKLREKLRQKDIDAALVAKRENYIYLSGFTGTSAHLVITQNDAILITDFRYVGQAALQAPSFKTIQYQGKLIDTISEVLKERKINKLGFEESYLTYGKYAEYRTKLDTVVILPLEGIIEGLRIIKTQDEIDIIKKAVKIADNAFSHILGYIKPGIMEIEIAAELEYYMRKQGAKGAAFETVVASGIRSSMPHGVASEKKLQSGDAIVLDYGAIYNEYCSDMTRTVFLGKPDERISEIYSIVLDAQKRALKGAKKGLFGKEIDCIARDIIAKCGHGENFGHGLGHGVGLEIHEEPRLSPTSDIKIENGVVVTIEPGIYLNGAGGVRIEDLIVIRDDKPEILTKSTKEMIII